MKIRMIATDLDGTLLGRDGRVSEKNAEALRACEARGILTVIASGRGLRSVAQIARDIGLHSPIISNGGARVDESGDGPMLLEDVFETEASIQVYRILKQSGLFFECHGRERVYRVNTLYAPDWAKGEADDEALMEAEGVIEPQKYIVFDTDRMERLAAVKQRLARETDCALSSSWFNNVEVLARGAGKGRAVRVLQERYGIAREETMAFGDNLNDLDMLEAVGVPVAMENAVDEIKRAALLIAPHHDESGVGRVIRDYVLGECSD